MRPSIATPRGAGREATGPGCSPIAAAAPELRLFRLAGQLLGRWRRALERSVAAELVARRKMALASLASVAVQEAIGLVMVIVLLLLALRQSISLGDLVALLYGLSRFRDLARIVGDGLQNLFIYRAELGHLRVVPRPGR